MKYTEEQIKTREKVRLMIEKHNQEMKLTQENFLARHDYMYFEDCKEGYTYKIDARNFTYAIFYKGVFHGIRHKFTNVFIDNEIHWDKDDHYGTVKPIKELEETPTHIFNMLKYYTDTNYTTGIKERLNMAFVAVRHYLEGFIK